MTIWYTKTHQWYNDENGEVGLTPFAAEQLGEISFVDVDALEGAELTQLTMDGDEPTSDPIDATVESSKAVGDIYSPVSGTVKEVNGDLMDEPEKINEDGFSAWLYKIDASNWDAEKGNLLDEAAYKAFTDSLK
ncbi:MAG: glycine cleavage system protein H [Promethearchaeota archaeon Loki_b31]|uniref:Lipoyl-binding domain-containing protein n=1 Tax=marine sediment metagenome TaxID=412755 RepID=X1IWA5_9ZZZZ|nr:MAG: glycine cleavage system protein H [Candidatus Lokiarchaeota archaeon Loki_b31]